MQNPLVSIIIPTYNRAHLIGETIDSVIAQTYTNWECIVVDDGSTDNTDEVLSLYCGMDERIKYFHRPKNRLPGGNASRNYGFELSSGEFVQWFDDDDIMLEEFLNIKVQSIKPKLNLIICSGYYVDKNLQNEKLMVLNENIDLFKEYVLYRLKIFTPSVLFRKSFLIGKKLFSTRIYRGQETEFFSRLFFEISNNSYCVKNTPLFLYRKHNDSKTQENLIYVNEFKTSLSFISINNFKRGVKIKDFEIINFHYIILINLFFRAIENNHLENSRFIIKSLNKELQLVNKMRAIEFVLLSNFAILFKKRNFRIEKRLKQKLLI